MNKLRDDIIKLINITKQYGENEKALNNLNLNIKSGEMLAIMGESGSGKTTLLNIVGGNLTNYSGQYLFLGKQFNQFSSKEISRIKNRQIGFVRQEFELIDDFSIYNNVKLPLLFNEEVNLNKIGPLVLSSLHKVNMQNKVDKKIKRLSGGEKQRVAIARAIINNPKVIIADEPTGALDSHTTMQIMELFRKINKEDNVTFIIATHNKYVADKCDRIIILEDGKVV